MNLYLIADSNGRYYTPAPDSRQCFGGLERAKTWGNKVSAQQILRRLKRAAFSGISIIEMSEEEFNSKTTWVGQKYLYVEFSSFPAYFSQIYPHVKEDVTVIEDDFDSCQLSNGRSIWKRHAFDFVHKYIFLVKNQEQFDRVIRQRTKRYVIENLSTVDAEEAQF